jgi:hypothetical protein
LQDRGTEKYRESAWKDRLRLDAVKSRLGWFKAWQRPRKSWEWSRRNALYDFRFRPLIETLPLIKHDSFCDLPRNGTTKIRQMSDESSWFSLWISGLSRWIALFKIVRVQHRSFTAGERAVRFSTISRNTRHWHLSFSYREFVSTIRTRCIDSVDDVININAKCAE